MAIFGFFVLFAGRKYRDHLNEYNQVRFEMAKQLTEYQLDKSPFDADDISPSFQAFIEHLDLAFKSKIWLTDSDGTVIIHSFKASFPDDLIEDLLTNRITEEAIIKHRHYQAYRKGPINLGDGRQGSIHLLFDRHPPFAYGSGFGIGLFLIGLIVALLTFPLARKISKPIKILTESTKRLEQGDLGHRTTASSRDEIGELASAFNRMAEKLERMVKTGKEMTAQVSHELRSPLARIQIAVEILKDRLEKTEDTESATHLETIRLDVEELDRIIGRILELSKLDLQNDSPYTDVFLPVKTLQEALDRYEVVIRKKRISISNQLTDDAKIIGNREALGTVFSNLLDNAVRYTPTQGRLRLASRIEDERLVIGIENSGKTLSASDLEKIFNPFVRIDTNGESGAGLGLSIARKIVEKHNGLLTAANTEAGILLEVSLPTARIE